ncbi:MAG: iron-sulfur cluster assembly scaffold protein [Pseudomonadota bacterium]
MASRSNYTRQVRSYFRSPRHAGSLAEVDAPVIAVTVSEGGAGVRIRLEGTSDGACWQQLAWRVFGCPHTIAAAEAACRRFEGAPIGAPGEFAFVRLVEELGIPVEKTGRVLLLEDAFRALEAARTGSLASVD